MLLFNYLQSFTASDIWFLEVTPMRNTLHGRETNRLIQLEKDKKKLEAEQNVS